MEHRQPLTVNAFPDRSGSWFFRQHDRSTGQLLKLFYASSLGIRFNGLPVSGLTRPAMDLLYRFFILVLGRLLPEERSLRLNPACLGARAAVRCEYRDW